MINFEDVFGVIGLPDDSFDLRELSKKVNPYDDLSETVEEIFSDDRRVRNRPYDPFN